MGFPRKLLIAGRVTHYVHEGRLYAYTPYVREIDLWSELFEEVMIAGTLRVDAPPADCSPFAYNNVTVLPVCAAGGDSLGQKLVQFFLLPKIIAQLIGGMFRADAIHARCPSDLGLLALIFAPLFSSNLIAKYAGQWMGFEREPAAWKLQRALLRSSWWRGPVTVYTDQSEQPGKIIPFFTSMLSDQQIARGRVAASKPRDTGVFRVLFVGRLSAARNVDTLLRAFRELQIKDGRRMECVIAGEGPERNALELLAADLGISDRTRFLGGLPFERVLECYESANVVVLAANSEGWGKAITEAMAFGCICVGSNLGVMPILLGNNRGLLVPPRDVWALSSALQYIADHPSEAALMAARSVAWVQKFSLSAMKSALREVMLNNWMARSSSPQIAPLQ